MRRNDRKSNGFKKIILEHINNNIKSYTILVILFLIGIILGVLFINNANDNQKSQIQGYITGFVDSLKSDYQIDNHKLLKNSIIDNLTLAVILWFISSTVIGMVRSIWNSSLQRILHTVIHLHQLLQV